MKFGTQHDEAISIPIDAAARDRFAAYFGRRTYASIRRSRGGLITLGH